MSASDATPRLISLEDHRCQWGGSPGHESIHLRVLLLITQCWRCQPPWCRFGTARSVGCGQLSHPATATARADQHTASIEKILNLNHDPRPAGESHHDASSANGLISHSAPILNEDGEPIWKVLVFDNMGRDVISSVLRVNDLRSWGVTIHLYVRSSDPCSGAPLTLGPQKHQCRSIPDPRCARRLSRRTDSRQHQTHHL